jgi:hypothetical protein
MLLSSSEKVSGKIVDGHLRQSLIQERDFRSSFLVLLLGMVSSPREDKSVLLDVVLVVMTVVVV